MSPVFFLKRNLMRIWNERSVIMEFTESFFEDEVREGFFVPGMMKRAWAAQLEVYEAVMDVCRRNGITCYAEWGTLLGAVRHGGMIPWDDDMDLCMKRKDYEKFLKIAENELPEGYWIMNYRTHDTDNMVTKIINYPISLIQEKDLPKHHGYPYLSSIDLFALDYLPPDRAGKDAIWELTNLVAELNCHIDKNDMEGEEIDYALRGFEKICGITIDPEKPMKRQLVRALENVAARFDERTSKELTAISYYYKNREYRFPKSYYREAVEMPFENTTVFVPAQYDRLLRLKYGDYRKPVRACDSHAYPAYKGVHDTIRDQMKIEPFQYHYSGQEADKIHAERKPGVSLKEQAQAFLPLFCEAHEEVKKKAENADGQSAAAILGECQETAIQLGGMIDERLGEGNAVVGILEQYCEFVFKFYTVLTGEENCFQTGVISEFCEELALWDGKLADAMEQHLHEKKEIVFIPYKTAYWNGMEKAWRAAMDDEDANVYVIPAPYYYKDDYGKVKSDEPHYETDYPEGVTITSYEEYNFEVHHPDIIVTQYPYDEYNYALTIHPFFYSSNLVKYTDELIFIPPFAMDEIKPEDERGRVTLRYLCNTPGVVHADKVVVQSEQMKEVYVELLTEFAGEDTKQMWEKKIHGAKSSLYESCVSGGE